MRELLLVFLGLATGALMLVWAIWQITSYLSQNANGRRQRRFYYRIAWFIGLIGLADLAKALHSLFANSPLC